MVIPPVPRYTDSSGHFDPWLAIPGGLPCRSHTFKYSASGFETQYLDYCIPPLASVLLPDVTLPCPPPGPCDYLNWNEYPYCPEGSNMCFPDDEGQHFSYVEHPAEWWYANFHLTGESGREYGAFVAFFKLPRARLFGISDLEQGIMYTDVRLPPFSTIYDHFNRTFEFYAVRVADRCRIARGHEWRGVCVGERTRGATGSAARSTVRSLVQQVFGRRLVTL